MRFVVSSPKACASNGRARAGFLYAGSSCNSGGGGVEIETPALLVSTRKGLPNFISRDLLSSLPLPLPHSRLLHVSPLNFIECPPLKTISSVGGLHRMVGLDEYVFVASARDSIVSLPESGATNKLGASFETPSGRRLVKPSEFVEMISSLKPNLWASLADEVPVWVSEKRNTASVDRTIRWLDECLNIDKAGVAAIMGSVVGGSNIEERKRCATEVSLRNVSGFWIGGFGLGESIEERPALLNVVMDILPEEKLRCISGLALPEEVLQGVAAGVDIFDSTYIYHLTLGGFALIFPPDVIDGETVNSQPSDSGSDGTKINLRATAYRRDASPIVGSCTCFTCRNHTRAYINHLLNVHEMLAQILLEIHNTHHYMGFFSSIREAIKRGKFSMFRRNFIEGRHARITSAAACV